MKIQLKNLVQIQAGLKEILVIALSARVAYRLAKFSLRIDKENSALEKTRATLLNKYVKKDKDGKWLEKLDSNGTPIGEYDFAKGNKEKFGKEYSELVKEYIEIDFTPIRLKELGNAKIKTETLLKLGKIIGE